MDHFLRVYCESSMFDENDVFKDDGDDDTDIGI